MSKKESKLYSPEITQRFLLICDEVIRDGQVKNKSTFASSIGEHQQNLSKMDGKGRTPTLDQVARVCELYGYSPTWLILGIGEKKIKPAERIPLEGRVTNLEVELARIKRQLKAK